MQILHPHNLDTPSECPYLKARTKQLEYFIASDLNKEELSSLLAAGWRKFGLYYFRPACPGCRQCIPIRVPTQEFTPSRSQKRIAKKNTDIEVRFGPLRYSDRIYEIYREHARIRFEEESSTEDFLYNFYMPSCPTLQSELYLGEELVAVGFLDHGAGALSSVYFAFDPKYSERNLGTFSILKEIELAKRIGAAYYYLGYWVDQCKNLGYKDHFRPREHYIWSRKQWQTILTHPTSDRA